MRMYSCSNNCWFCNMTDNKSSTLCEAVQIFWLQCSSTLRVMWLMNFTSYSNVEISGNLLYGAKESACASANFCNWIVWILFICGMGPCAWCHSKCHIACILGTHGIRYSAWTSGVGFHATWFFCCQSLVSPAVVQDSQRCNDFKCCWLMNLQNRAYHINSMCFSTSRPGYIVRIDFGFITIDCVPYAEIFFIRFWIHECS